MQPATLAEYVERCRNADARALLATSQAPYLVETGIHQAVDDDVPAARVGFRTGEIDLDEVRARHLSVQQRQVFVLEKRAGGVFSELISVGRTPNVDIPLVRAGISKFHAHFSEASPGRYVITDKESRNGTFVGGVRIAANTPTPLEDGVEVRFASYCFRFMFGQAFVRLLEGLAEFRR